jgi:GNAT superfamily N-acetyltransferase
LDEYFQERVTQDVRRRITACFVALTDAQQVAGYYTMATASLLLNELPPTLAKKLPRYPTVPTIRMGRLAIDQEHQGKGLGGALLADGLDRAARSEIAAYAVLVDAKNSTAVDFYRHHGFIALPDSPQTLFLPLAALPK